jgi:hypothetical protein
MKIVIETIDHDQQRYETVGDWRWVSPNELHVKVSDMANWKYEALVGIHEAIEALLCKEYAISDKDVDAFDMDVKRIQECADLGIEPGDHPRAPYAMPHCFATGVERLLCSAMDVSWGEYEEYLQRL